MAELKIEVFTSMTCPFCPGAVRATKKLLADNPELESKVTWEELSTRSPEGSRKASAYGIRSVPTIVVTNKRGERGAHVGEPSQGTYLKMINEMLK